jgi:hypothetical protein
MEERRTFHLKLTLAIVSICVTAAIFSGIGDANSDKRAVRMKELSRIGEDLKNAVLSQDEQRILRYVRKEGIFCIDSLVEFRKVKKDLSDPSSTLYANLFGPGGMREYFQKATNQSIRVDFVETKGKENLESACLRYESSNYQPENWPEICVSYRDGKWGINNSLYNCL